MRPRPLFFVIRTVIFLGIAAMDQIPAFAAREAPIRTGLWGSLRVPQESGAIDDLQSRIRANPNLSGVCLSIDWNDIEKEPGKLDFRAIDKTVTMLRALSMKYELGIKPGMSTPSFVFQEGARAIETRVTNPRRANAGETVLIPVPWDPIYQRNFSRLIKLLGEHYGADPLCVSVVLSCANFMSNEMDLPKTPMDRAKWKAMGNYETELLDVYKKYTDEWASAFPHQAISLHVAKVLDLPPAFSERVVDYGLSKYPARFTIQNCQLNGRRENTGLMSYDLVQKYHDRVHHGFQSLATFHDSARMGSIEMAVLNVVHAQGEYWELWHRDGMSIETSSAILAAWKEASRLGYDAYKQKLRAEGKYREGQ